MLDRGVFLKESDVQFNHKNGVVSHDFEHDWNPASYLKEFYGGFVQPDEKEALVFERTALKSYLRDVAHKLNELGRDLSTDSTITDSQRAGILQAMREGYTRSIDFGCGPTVHRGIAAARYVSQIDAADYNKGNLEQVAKWVNNETDAHNWSNFTGFILNNETDKIPTRGQVIDREDLARSKYGEHFQADADNIHPLGVERRSSYPIVTSFFCADSSTGDKTVWENRMRNIASLTARGGIFIGAALREAISYRSGDAEFPSANVNEYDIKRVLSLDFSSRSINIKVRSLPEHFDQGYKGIVLFSARKPC